MQVLLLHLEAPLMSFGGPQVDHIGPTGRFPTVSQMAGLFGNALGYVHGEHARLQSLQDRLSIASALLRPGEEMQDYQTVDLGQEHLRNPAWTTRGRAEHRAGGPARFGTHIRLRRYRADALVLTAVTLVPAEEEPSLDRIAEALDFPARPLFLGRKNCLPGRRLVFAARFEANGLAEALVEAPSAFPEPWATLGCRETQVPAEWPLRPGDPLPPRASRHRVVDRRDWRNQLHGGERAVARGTLELRLPETGEGVVA